MDRYEIAKRTWETNLSGAVSGNFDLELLVADNGSTDPRSVAYFSEAHLDYFRPNSINEGVGRAFNQLYLRSTGDYIAMFGNDLQMTSGWLTRMVDFIDQCPNAGLVGADWGHSGVPPITTKMGIESHWLNESLNRVFGNWVFKRRVIEEIGFFAEEFGPYGLEDSDFNERVNLAGFNSCYLAHEKCAHIGVGVHDTGPYREAKDKSMQANAQLVGPRFEAFKTKGIREPLPPKRDPLSLLISQ